MYIYVGLHLSGLVSNCSVSGVRVRKGPERSRRYLVSSFGGRFFFITIDEGGCLLVGESSS